MNDASLNSWNELYLYNKTITKANLPSTITIHVKAKVDVPANTYTLGVRLTPDANYIEKLGEELLEKAQEGSGFTGAFAIIIEYVKNLNSLDKFKKGFNLIDVRLPSSEAPQSTYDEFRANSYGDTTRTMFGSYDDRRVNKETIDFTASDTLRLEEINDPNIMNALGEDVYNRKFENANPVNANPDIKIFIPNTNGSYDLVYNVTNVSQNTFNNKIKSIRNQIIPGTIIQYTWQTKPTNEKEASKILIDFQTRTEVDGTGSVGGSQTASLVKRQAEGFNKGYHIAWQTTPTYTDIPLPGGYINGIETKENQDYKLTPTKNAVMRVVENYDLVWCINWSAKFPMHENFWDEDLDEWQIQRVEIKSPEDLRPYLQQRNGQLASPYKLEYIFDRLKQGFYFIDKYPTEVNGVDYDLNRTTQYNGLMANFIGELTTDPNIYNTSLTQYQITAQDRFNTEALKGVITTHIDEWTPEVADSVKLYVYRNSKDTNGNHTGLGSDTYQNVITGKVFPPITISKVDEKGSPLSGADFRLISGDGDVITWTSDNQPKKLYLDPDSYTLEEVRAPKGRKPIYPYHFTVRQEKDTESSIEEKDIPLLKFRENKPDFDFEDATLIFDNDKAVIRDTTKKFNDTSAKAKWFAGGNLIIEKKYVEEDSSIKNVGILED